jgi:hypothetical protein
LSGFFSGVFGEPAVYLGADFLEALDDGKFLGAG